MKQPGNDCCEFGPFSLNPKERLLLRDGKPVPLTPKVFDTLTVLVRHSGHLVLKEDLMKTLWPDSFVEEDNLTQNISVLRKALGESAQGQRYIVTVPGQGYRFTAEVVEKPAPAEEQAGLLVGSYTRSRVLIEEEEEREDVSPPIRHRRRMSVAIVGVTATVIAGIWFAVLHRPRPRFTERNPVVLTDFANRTGDPIFDDTLEEALAVKLGESPFLNIVSRDRIREELRLMARSPNEKLTSELGRQVCQRLNATATITGSIAPLGSQYVIGLDAVDCQTGDTLAREQVQCADREKVLDALGQATATLRRKLGESLSSMKRFNTPVEQATTPSLQALQAYSLGRQALNGGEFKDAILLFGRASRLDPGFAMSYTSLATTYSNLGESDLAAENARKAYELRNRVSEREKLYIESHYYDLLGDVDDARETYLIWAQTYPGDSVPVFNLGNIYSSLGQHEKALEMAQTSLRLGPDSALNYGYLATAYSFLNRFVEAHATLSQAQAKWPDSPVLHFGNYFLGFLQHDETGMATEVAWARSNSEEDDVLLAAEADTAGYYGRLATARALSRQAVASAEGHGASEAAATYEGEAALREALFGNANAAQQYCKAALGRSQGREVLARALLALALSGDSAPAQKLAHEWARSYPQDTLAKFNFLPTIRAAIAIDQNDLPQATNELEAARPYELGSVGPDISLAAVFLRGQAYLRLHRGKDAAAEFQKILDHPGIVAYSSFGTLAHLGLARAYVVQGNTTAARTSYGNFLTLWKHADAGIPILQQAKAEYARLN